MPRSRSPGRTASGAPTTVTIRGTRAEATTPEGTSASVTVKDFAEGLCREGEGSERWLLPPGGRGVVPLRGGGLITIIEIGPGVRPLRWIDKRSPEREGLEARYRRVHIALPYMIVLAGFRTDGKGLPRLGNWNECFFRREPLQREEDKLLYPALLNCSRFERVCSRPLSWICTEHLDRSALCGPTDRAGRVREGVWGLVSHLLQSGFNESFEEHGLKSWFTETVRAGIDPRLASIESWEEASRENPLFALDVPWLPVRMSLVQILDRMKRGLEAETAPHRPRRAEDLARVIFRLGRTRQRGSRSAPACSAREERQPVLPEILL